jgi:hypothetical protein
MHRFYKITIWLLALTIGLTFGPEAALAQYTAQEYAVRLGGFLARIILPLLFSIAFLFFIYNTAKYFIFHGDEESSREEGKRNALYSVAAFVFLISIWFIVGLLTQGLGLNERRSICADYFDIFDERCTRSGGSEFDAGGTIPAAPGGGTSGTGSGGGSGSGGSTNGGGSGSSGSGGTGAGTGGSGSGGTGGGTGTGGGDTDGGGTSSGGSAPLAELLFGTGEDNAGFHRSLVVSGALASTPNIATTASCIDGIETLKLAARAETTQAAYLYYETSAGQTRWQNITDRTSQNYVGYDRDVLDSLIGDGATNLHLVHLHPDRRVDGLDLAMDGHGPSVADMRLMCELNDPAIRYVTVDETNVWVTRHTDTTCPYRPTATPQLAIIETYTSLASLEPNRRATELAAYLNSSLVPNGAETYFEGINRATLSTQTSHEILSMSSSAQTRATTTVRLFGTTEGFCSGR